MGLILKEERSFFFKELTPIKRGCKKIKMTELYSSKLYIVS